MSSLKLARAGPRDEELEPGSGLLVVQEGLNRVEKRRMPLDLVDEDRTNVAATEKTFFELAGVAFEIEKFLFVAQIDAQIGVEAFNQR